MLGKSFPWGFRDNMGARITSTQLGSLSQACAQNIERCRCTGTLFLHIYLKCL